MRLCFVVHRYAPYPGGTENYVKALAEESLRRGHDVWVYSDRHQGDLNGVKVTSDKRVLRSRFDLIVVHGGVTDTQAYTLSRSARLPSPVLYLLISHNGGYVSARGMRDCAAIGCSTADDRAIAERHGLAGKAVRVRHGVDKAASTGHAGFRAKFGVPADAVMFVSCGGYWAHKRMKELARIFESTKRDAILVTTGYYPKPGATPAKSSRVLPLLLENRDDSLSAILEADCYIMHSAHEGFGIVLLEAMINRTPWISHDVGGATQLRALGSTYRTDQELAGLIDGFRRDEERVQHAADFVDANHLVGNSIDDIEAAARGLAETFGPSRRSGWANWRMLWSHPRPSRASPERAG